MRAVVFVIATLLGSSAFAEVGMNYGCRAGQNCTFLPRTDGGGLHSIIEGATKVEGYFADVLGRTNNCPASQNTSIKCSDVQNADQHAFMSHYNYDPKKVHIPRRPGDAPYIACTDSDAASILEIIALSDIAVETTDALKCNLAFLNSYAAQPGSEQSKAFDQKAFDAFNRNKDKISSLMAFISEKQGSIDLYNNVCLHYDRSEGALPPMGCDTEFKQRAEAAQEALKKSSASNALDTLLDQIPLGTDEAMRTAMKSLATQPNVSQAQFQQTFRRQAIAVQRGLVSFQNELRIGTKKDGNGRVVSFEPTVREKLLNSQAYLQSVNSNPGLSQKLKNILSCRQANHARGKTYVGVTIIGASVAAAAFTAGTSLTAAGAAGGAAVAEVATAGAVASAEGGAAVGLVSSDLGLTALNTGLGAIGTVQTIEQIYGTCYNNATAVATGRTCSPQDGLNLITERATRAECAANIAMAAVATVPGIIQAAAKVSRALAEVSPALSESAREAARESLRAKGITEANYSTFFDRANPVALSDDERLFLFEQYSGLGGAQISQADRRVLMDLHNVGDGYGHYTVPQLRAKVQGLRDFLISKGITDPERIKAIVDKSIRQGVFGKVAAGDRKGIMSWLTSAFRGAVRDAAPAEARPQGLPQPPANFQGGVQEFRETGREVLDTGRNAPELQAARNTPGGDLFAPKSSARTLDQMITSGDFQNEPLYGPGRGYSLWWTKKSIPGRESLSPMRGHFERQGVESRRTFFWPNRQIEASTRNAEYPVALDRYAIVVNEAKTASGEFKPESLEAIGRGADGKYYPLYYVREGDHWVPSRTFEGHPVNGPNGCIRCHSHPDNPNEFTHFPYNAARNPNLRSIDRLSPGYQEFGAGVVRDENLRRVMRDRLARPNTLPPAVDPATLPNRQALKSRETQLAARRNSAEINQFTAQDGANRLRLTEKTLGQPLEGPEYQPQRSALSYAATGGPSGNQHWNDVDKVSILRWGMTRQKLRDRLARGEGYPEEVFSADEVNRIMRNGLVRSPRGP